jgi:hypothetical protein
MARVTRASMTPGAAGGIPRWIVGEAVVGSSMVLPGGRRTKLLLLAAALIAAALVAVRLAYDLSGRFVPSGRVNPTPETWPF